MAGDPRNGPVADFAALDFDRLWRGRSKTTEVETAALRRSLAAVDGGRLLEIGAGAGRLTPVVRARAGEFVALDLTRTFLDRLDPAWTRPPQGLRVAANVYRLPFRDASFTGAVMVRVYNFLSDPVAALAEVARVLTPNGTLVLAHNPRPSPGTLAGDVRAAFARERPPGRSETFTFAERTPVRPSSFPAWSFTRRAVARDLGRAGFEVHGELGTGLEDFRPFRWMPTAVFSGLGGALGGTADGLFPTRFVTAARTGAPTGAALPGLAEAITCPRCGARGFDGGLLADWSQRCATCGFELRYADGVLEAVASGDGPRPIPPHGVSSVPGREGPPTPRRS